MTGGNMAIGADVVSGGQGYLVRGAGERARAFIRAERHTRIVKFLRKALPIFALIVLAAYFVNSQIGLSISVGDLTASIDGMEVADGNLRMTNPKFQGADKRNGNYVIGADYADQDMKDPTIIKLNAIRAELTTPDGGWSRMNAVRGVFNSKTERLVMQEKITVATSSGITGELKHASLETKNRTLRSHQPVFFNLPNGRVAAAALTFRSSDGTLTFRGNVRVHVLKKQEQKQTKTENQASPAVPPLPEDTSARPAEPQ
jgi:lipopolysaccharide export system protein LptC